jgi:hypothetical protein
MGSVNGDQSQDIFDPKWVMLIALFSSPAFFLLFYYGYPGKGKVASAFVGMILFAIRARWGLRKYMWFWLTVAIIFALHLPIVWYVPWPDERYPNIALLPLALLDYALVRGCIKVVEKLINRSDEAGSTN